MSARLPKHGNWNTGAIRDKLAYRSGDLDQIHCPCGCPEILIVGICHPDAPVRVAYDSIEKVALLVCSECSKFIMKFKVAEGLS